MGADAVAASAVSAVGWVPKGNAGAIQRTQPKKLGSLAALPGMPGGRPMAG